MKKANFVALKHTFKHFLIFNTIAFIDAPYAYVQQVTAQRNIFQADLWQNQRIAQQDEAVIKFLITIFGGLNKLYPTVLEDSYQLTTTEAANLLEAMPKRESIERFSQELQQATATNPLEAELLVLIRENTKNFKELLETLAVFAQPLNESEEAEADIFWAKKIEAEINEQEITSGLDDLLHLFN